MYPVPHFLQMLVLPIRAILKKSAIVKRAHGSFSPSLITFNTRQSPCKSHSQICSLHPEMFLFHYPISGAPQHQGNTAPQTSNWLWLQSQEGAGKHSESITHELERKKKNSQPIIQIKCTQVPAPIRSFLGSAPSPNGSICKVCVGDWHTTRCHFPPGCSTIFLFPSLY